MIRSLLVRLARDDKGVTLIEFAMVVPVLAVLLMGLFDLGYRSYAASVLQGALHDAARTATVGGYTMPQIDARVRQQLSHFASVGSVTTATSSYYDFSAVSMPEKITSDTAPTGQYNAGDCFEDANGNGSYDLDRGRGGMGGADDIVRYTVTLTYPRVFPMAGLLGWSESETITSNTVLRNQPYAGRSVTTSVICTPPTP